MNSLDLYRGRDDLDGVATARQMLHDLPDSGREVRVDAAVLPEVRLARAGLRWSIGCATLWALDDAEPQTGPPDWTPSPQLLLDTGGLQPSARGVHALLSAMALDLLVAQRTRTLARLKPCANPACQWVFWDASRPGSGRWCSMRLCGGQSKSRRFRARRADTEG